LTAPGCFSERVSSFSATWQKTKQKNTPVFRLILRVAVAAGARGNSPACGGLKQSARLFLSASPMLGAGQREIKKQTFKNRFSSLLQWGYLKPFALREELHGLPFIRLL